MTGLREAVGVLGGTFDPVHLGHLAIAERARTCLPLRRLLLMPSAVPPHKEPSALSPARHRESMLRLALCDHDGLDLDTTEVDLGGVRYTLDTLRVLRRRLSPLAPVFIMGMDSLLELPTWYEYRRLIREFDLVVFDRPGMLLDDLRDRLDEDVRPRLRTLGESGRDRDRLCRDGLGDGGRIYHLSMAPVAISSREIRARVAAGRSIDELVPPAVAGYIQENGLYRQEDRN